MNSTTWYIIAAAALTILAASTGHGAMAIAAAALTLAASAVALLAQLKASSGDQRITHSTE